MKELWTSVASMLGVFAFCQTLFHTIFPPEFRFAFLKLFSSIFNWFSPYCYFDITEIDGVNTNELYNAVQVYLSSSVSAAASSTRLSLSRPLNSTSIAFGLSNNEVIVDSYKNVAVLWEHVVSQRQSQSFSWRPLPEEKRGFTLRIKKKDKTLILESYLDYIIETANELRRKNQDRLLYTNSRGAGSMESRGHPWESVQFKHPSTFETLAMDPIRKQEIMDDLMDFTNARSFYQKTGRAWKRGYLLYGPPGTGKSSMIAAMANFMKYDIYDLELTEVKTNSDLRTLLMKTSSKSIIVIEDIDCSINLTNRKKEKKDTNVIPPRPELEMQEPGCIYSSMYNNSSTITLSGLLNFTDGLWSCCGSERIFVFTTNHVDKLDPALLRSGRMDMHIFMSYCSFPALKILLKNYLGLEEWDLDEVIGKELEEVIDEAEMTPADVSEVLIKHRRNKEKALRELLEALKAKADGRKNPKDEKGKDVKEEEEQEKRTLENPEQDCCNEFDEDCKKGDEKEKLN